MFPRFPERATSTASGTAAGAGGTAASASGTAAKVLTTGIPMLSISNVRQAVPTKGSSNFVFTVTRTGNLTSASTVAYSTASATAKAGTNFKPASGELSFAAGASTATVSVPVMAKQIKSNATFVVSLARPMNASLAESHAVGTIVGAKKAPKAPKPKPTPNPAAKGIKINFEPSGGPAVKGYLEDTGLAYGSRGTLSFGWSGDNTANAVDRKAVKDPRYDTFNVLGSPGAANWQISLPDGRYRVSLFAGDPSNITSSYQVDANGALVLNGKAKKNHPFISGSAIVSVTDGTLILTPGSDASADDLDFLKIKYVGALKA